MPPTESPSRLVPCASDEDIPPPEELLACEMIALANTVHGPFTETTQTFCPLAKLVELLLEARTVPALSLTEVPLLTTKVDTWSSPDDHARPAAECSRSQLPRVVP